MNFSYQPSHARLSWNAEGLPWSEDYGDVYFSRADALGESTHVFLHGNKLPERFAGLNKENFTIGELGFGAGLNFLNTCRLWCQHAPGSARLHYVACELHPFKLADLARLQQLFGELDYFSAGLLAHYPDHTNGVHQLELHFGAHCINLTLLYGDATSSLEAYRRDQHFLVDVWFLDGFSPKANAAMWHSTLFQQLALMSHTDTTATTYSVAGSVREALSAAGFSWEKQPGFASKRHMLFAAFKQAEAKTVKSKKADQHERTVYIIGGGLAGCSTAYMLARSGWQVILIERESELAAQASGNPQGVLHCKPATVDTPDNRFNLHAYLYAARFYRSLDLPASVWSASGMLQLAHDHKMAKRFTTFAQNAMYAPDIIQVLDSAQASALCKFQVQQAALYFPHAGWLSPVELCRFYCSHPSITVRYGRELCMLDQDKSGWELIMHGEHGEEFYHAAHVVLCNSADVHRFQQTGHIPVICNRGQVDIYEQSPATAVDMVICGQGYIIPGLDGRQTIGGSFHIAADSTQILANNSQLHLEQLRAINTDLANAMAAQPLLQQRSGTRCTMADRMPVVGEISRKNRAGLWINVAHGSQGLARTPISAALLASSMNHTPPPVSADLRACIGPQRYFS